MRTGQPSRSSRTIAANLAERFTRDRDAVLRFATGFSVPFTNNRAERDLQMVKLQQKISRCYRTEAGATNYLTIRSYLSTARTQGVNVLDARRDLFEGHPFMPGVARARTARTSPVTIADEPLPRGCRRACLGHDEC